MATGLTRPPRGVPWAKARKTHGRRPLGDGGAVGGVEQDRGAVLDVLDEHLNSRRGSEAAAVLRFQLKVNPC